MVKKEGLIVNEYRINTGDIINKKQKLRAEDVVLLTGTVYTARDMAHKLMVEMIEKNQPLAFDLFAKTLYYAGPTPSKTAPVGSCGPTTSSRMDEFTIPLLELGVCSIIGKGPRSEEVKRAFFKHQAVYFCAIGGAGALASLHIVKCEKVAFKDLGCEAIHKLELDDFPVVVGYDIVGNSIFD